MAAMNDRRRTTRRRRRRIVSVVVVAVCGGGGDGDGGDIRTSTGLEMDELPGAIGTSASLALRLGQAIFSIASLLFMCVRVEFYGYTAFCFLVTIKGLTIPWSLTLAVVDAIAVFIKRPSRQVGVVSVIVIGDWVLSLLSLAAACSTASVADFMLTEVGAPFCTGKLCSRYQLSAAMAFLSWCLSIASSLFNLWLLPSLY